MARVFKFKEITQAEILKGRLEEIGTVLIQRSKGPEEVLPTGDLVGQYLFEDEEGNYLDPRSIVDSDDVAIVFVNGKVIADTGHSERVKEQEPFPEIPEVAFEFNGFEDFVAGVEKSFSVKVTATGIDETTALKYKATFKKGDNPVANQEIWYEEGQPGNWKTFETDENGVAYFGPKDGFTMSDLDLSQGVETGFKATIAETGEYTLAVELINAGTYETIDEAEVLVTVIAS